MFVAPLSAPFVICGILDSWYEVDEDISTATGQGRTVKDDGDFRRRRLRRPFHGDED
jgi:hypothetical protein